MNPAPPVMKTFTYVPPAVSLSRRVATQAARAPHLRLPLLTASCGLDGFGRQLVAPVEHVEDGIADAPHVRGGERSPLLEQGAQVIEVGRDEWGADGDRLASCELQGVVTGREHHGGVDRAEQSEMRAVGVQSP